MFSFWDGTPCTADSNVLPRVLEITDVVVTIGCEKDDIMHDGNVNEADAVVISDDWILALDSSHFGKR